jgi:hypothetical protein
MPSPHAAAHTVFMLSTSCVASLSVNFFCMRVGVGGPSHLHTGHKIFEVLYIICNLFCVAVILK